MVLNMFISLICWKFVDISASCVEYVPEPAELDDGMDEEFRKIFSQLSFRETSATQDNDNKDESAENAASTKKANSDLEEEEQDNPQKEKGVSNKKKKLQRQMQIAKLKQICSRPDVVEGKCGIEKQPFQLPDFFAATGIEKIRQRLGRVEEEIEMLQLKLNRIGEGIAFSGRFK
ncbi:uncharacterized protein LOC142635243 [Castanea sativa]|uniref:uncharacterized protein LOC142635243 n=1 Tax=Castanea sativa TaxID=21020 RepID=UPI003F64A54E